MEMRGVLFFGLAAAVILLTCLIHVLLLYEKMRRRYEALLISYRQMQNMNETLRSQRHDYLNHMQVVYGMLELEEYEEIHAYLSAVYKNLMKTGKAIRTSIPAVNALLMAKLAEAEGQGIDFYIEVKSDLKKLRTAPWELCKVLSNLIDNAVTALLDKEGERRLSLDISEDREAYLFTVSDNGAPIPKERQKAIFLPGVTTKQEEGHGMGLFIVSNVLKENGGSIRLHSDEEETVFTVRIGKEETDREG